MKKRILFITLMVTLLACAFALSVGAKEITVGSSDCDYTGINNAVSNASDGDTIIIKTDISGGTISWDKSLTYILEANWTNISSSNASASSPNKTINVYARGGNREMQFKSDSLFNSYNSTYTEGMTLNFGGEDNYTLTLNVSGVTRRFLYGFTGATVNFYKGTIFTGSQKNSWQGDDTTLDCGTFNLYDGAEIRGNREIGSSTVKGFISASKEINIYGGKIYGNIISSSGYAFIRCTGNFNMYGGEIYDNYCLYASTGSDHGPGLINAVEQNIYGGTIHNNYMKKGNSRFGGTVFGSRSYTNKGDYSTPCHAYLVDNTVYDNYSFNVVTSITNDNYLTYFSVEANGAYKLKDASFLTVVDFQRSYEETLYAYSVVFCDTNSKVINAYMVNSDGTVLKSVDGTAAVTIPTDVEAWSTKANYCVTATPITNAQGTYYVAIEHTLDDDYNCTTALACIACNSVVAEAQEHDFVVVITYASGYTVAGEKSTSCTHEGCTADNTVVEAKALFTSKGYSKDTTSSAIVLNIKVDNEAVLDYEAYLKSVDENATILYGVAVAISATDDKPLNDDATSKSGTLAIKFNEKNYSNIEIKVTGIDEENYKTGIYCSGYIYVNNKVTYINGATTADTATKVTYATLPSEE